MKFFEIFYELIKKLHKTYKAHILDVNPILIHYFPLSLYQNH